MISFTSPDLLFWFVLLFSVIVFILSFIRFFSYSGFKIIIFLRGTALILVLLLFLNPKIDIKRKESKSLVWQIFIDKSLSMRYYKQPSSSAYLSGIISFLDQLKQSDVQMDVYSFGSQLDTVGKVSDLGLNSGSTNLGHVFRKMDDNKRKIIAGAVIFTDGQINQGSLPSSFDLKPTFPIHIIGVGDTIPMIDLAVQSIDAPPVVVKGEKIDLDVLISSLGNISERINVTLFHGDRLIGSKVINVSGHGGRDQVRFRVEPAIVGETSYRVQVSALADEINIQNNRQIVRIHILKDKYGIAMLTGAPNYNTSILKHYIGENQKYELDHFVYGKDGFLPDIKSFWEKKYQLIIFDNHPVTQNEHDWKSFNRIFAKKLISHQSGFTIISGPESLPATIASYLNLMNLELKKPILMPGIQTEWNFTKEWVNLFAFQGIEWALEENINLPPLLSGIETTTSEQFILAEYNVSGVNVPLLVAGEKKSMRYIFWSSPDMSSLHYKLQGSNQSKLLGDMWNIMFGWLMKTGGNKEFFFRTDKNSYQQGEAILLTGKPTLSTTKVMNDGIVNLFSDGNKISVKPLSFDLESKEYKSRFWASQSGQIEYTVEINQSKESYVIGRGSFDVEESQIELNHVFLNDSPLKIISQKTDGEFRYWENRDSLVDLISPKTKSESYVQRAVLHENIWIMVSILILLTSEWILRRRVGLM